MWSGVHKVPWVPKSGHVRVMRTRMELQMEECTMHFICGIEVRSQSNLDLPTGTSSPLCYHYVNSTASHLTYEPI